MGEASAAIPAWLLEAEVAPPAIVLYAHMGLLEGSFDAEILAARMRCTVVSVYRYLGQLIAVGAVTKNGRRDYTLARERPEAVA